MFYVMLVIMIIYSSVVLKENHLNSNWKMSMENMQKVES